MVSMVLQDRDYTKYLNEKYTKLDFDEDEEEAMRAYVESERYNFKSPKIIEIIHEICVIYNL